MNRFTKVYTFLIVVTGACAFLSLGFAAMAEKDQPGLARTAILRLLNQKAGQELEATDESFDLEQDFNRVKIESSVGGIEVVAVEEGRKPRLRFSGGIPKNGEKPFRFKIENQTLNVELKTSNSWRLILNGEELSTHAEDLKTTLELPKSWTGSLALATVNDEITVDGLNLDELVLKTVNGAAQTEGTLSARSVVANTVNGELELYGHFRNVKANAVNGDIELGLPSSGSWNFNITSINGSVENDLPSKSGGRDGTIDINSVSGSVRIKSLEQKEQEDDE